MSLQDDPSLDQQLKDSVPKADPVILVGDITSERYGITLGKEYECLFEYDSVYEVKLDNGNIGCRPKGFYRVKGTLLFREQVRSWAPSRTAFVQLDEEPAGTYTVTYGDDGGGHTEDTLVTQDQEEADNHYYYLVDRMDSMDHK